MKEYLFLFTIGPVQSFISQSRKTKDLYSSSSILSILCKSAIEQLRRISNDCEIIFPNEEALVDDETLTTIPNRFLASIKQENDDQVYDIGMELEDYVRSEFYNMCTIKHSSPTEFIDQIKDFLEVYWASIEKTDYKRDFTDLESSMGAIKGIRAFEQLNQKSGSRKCSICGQRNALKYDRMEGLCAICWAKRNFENYLGEMDSYPSTAKISVMHELHTINQSGEGSRLLKDYKQLLGRDFDEELLFEENLNETYFQRTGLDHSNLKDIQSLHLSLKEYMAKNELSFSKYYALIALDGDDMGRWVSGDLLKDREENFIEFHKDISKKLVQYCRRVSDIIRYPKGQLVYSGGDDVLAFVNLNYLTEVLKQVRSEFPQFSDRGAETTASCGVCIAHYKIPLRQVLYWTREAERAAKGMPQKNALSLVVLRHAGEITQGTVQWGDNSTESVDVIENILSLLKDQYFSPSFLYNIQEEFRLTSNIPAKAVESEIERLVRRSLIMKDKDLENNMADNVKKLYRLTKWDNENFFPLLSTIAFLSKGGD